MTFYMLGYQVGFSSAQQDHIKVFGSGPCDGVLYLIYLICIYEQRSFVVENRDHGFPSCIHIDSGAAVFGSLTGFAVCTGIVEYILKGFQVIFIVVASRIWPVD